MTTTQRGPSKAARSHAHAGAYGAGPLGTETVIDTAIHLCHDPALGRSRSVCVEAVIDALAQALNAEGRPIWPGAAEYVYQLFAAGSGDE